MASIKPRNYAEAWERAQELLRQGRLNDPGEHFPYKHAEVSALIAENPAYGPEGPDDDRVRVEDFITQDIADATQLYIDAQADYLEHPGDGTKAEYVSAKDRLVAARQAHRSNRTAPVIVGIRAPRSGE